VNTNKVNGQYEVLSPWADADPKPLMGISPRITDLAGKRIGLFRNVKPAGGRIQEVIEEKLKARFPTTEFSHFLPIVGAGMDAYEGENKDDFEPWVKSVDAVILAVGD
jgi:hypothetical protein